MSELTTPPCGQLRTYNNFNNETCVINCECHLISCISNISCHSLIFSDHSLLPLNLINSKVLTLIQLSPLCSYQHTSADTNTPFPAQIQSLPNSPKQFGPSSRILCLHWTNEVRGPECRVSSSRSTPQTYSSSTNLLTRFWVAVCWVA